MKSAARTLSLLISAAFVWFGSTEASGQTPGCATVQGAPATQALPRFAGTLTSFNLSTAGGTSNYLYVLTQWGFARASLANPAAPTAFTQVVIADEPGSGNGGLIQLSCDCHQGGSVFDVAEAADGSSRMISDFNAARLAPTVLAPAEVGRADGSGTVRFGQQAKLGSGSDGRMAQGGRIAAIYVASSGKYYGYVPTADNGVAIVDMTTTSGQTAKSYALTPSSFLGWMSSASAVRLTAARVNFGGTDLYLLAGSVGGNTIRVGTINPANGSVTEAASAQTSGAPGSLSIGVVNGRIFVLAAENTAGLHAYEYTPSQFGGTLTPVATSIPGNFDRVMVRGSQFPAIFGHNKMSLSSSFIEIYDSKWLTQGGSAVKAGSVAQIGASEPYFDNSFEAIVRTTGSQVHAYLYRLKSPGVANAEAIAVAQVVDISCIAADLSAPPVAGASMTNLSAASRSGAEATKNYYGDRWRVQNSSSSGATLDQIEWDFNVLNVGGTYTFQVDPAFSGALPNGTLSDLNPVYFPCDPSGSVVGDPRAGTNCHASAGYPGGSSNFRIGVRSHNANGWSTNGVGNPPAFISPAVTIESPSAQVAGFSDGILRALSGGQLDARSSLGNIADALFQWTFWDQAGQAGNIVGSPAGQVVSLPTASRSFRLTVTYADGYQAPVLNGAIQQVDLVPDFTLNPSPVVKNGTLTLTNAMQISTSATLTSVTYTINSSPALSGTLASSFISGSPRQDTVTVPGTPGSYTIQLTYNFSGPSAPGAQSLSVTKTFEVIDQIILNLTANPTSADSGVTINFTATGGLPTSTYGWNFGDNPFAASLTPGGATNSHAYSSPGTYLAIACVTNVSPQVCDTASVTITGSAPPPPPPPPPPPGNVSVSLSCPAQGATGAAVSCTATASGGTGSYSYQWNWGDNVLGGFTPGGATNSHTYSTAGGYTVTVQVTSGTASATATANVNVVPGGPPRPSAGYTITGATQNQFNGQWEAEAGQALTFAATETDAGATFSWTPSGSTSPAGPFTTNPASFAFTGPGSRTVELTVTGGGTVTAGVTSTTIRITVTPPRFQALMIPGAGHIDPVPPATDGTWATDLAVTNPGTQPMTITLHFETFGTEFPSDLSQIPFNSVNSVPLAAGQSWSATDVVKTPLGKDGRGVIILKYEGGNAEPIATATVYYTQQGRSFGSSLPTFKVGPYGSTTQAAEIASDQTLVGLRNDSNYRFNVSLFNASGQSGFYRLTAFGEDGSAIPIRGGNESGALELPIGAFQQALLQSGDLGLDDATKRYVLKATAVSGSASLIAAASALDRRNNDLVQVSDDTPRISAPSDTTIEYFIPGVGRIGRDEVPADPHWKTDLTLYSSSGLPRDLTFEYRYTDGNGAEQRVLAPVTIGSGKSLALDDIVGSILDGYTPVDLKQESTLGVLRISYRAASDSATAPLLIGGRIYDDRGSAGTAGMQLFVYSNGESVEPGSPLVLPGAQQNLRFRTNIGFFAMGDLPTTVRVSAVKQDGTAAGSFDFTLNDGSRSGHYAQLPMSAIPGIVGASMTIRVEVLSGSRIGAYVVTVDQISSDTVFVQGKPTRLAN